MSQLVALTLRFARVTSGYLDRCRASALAASYASPGWDPPDACLLDTGWAVGGLLRLCRSTCAAPEVIAALDRAVSGDADEDAGFLDHEEVYDGFGDPPRILAPAPPPPPPASPPRSTVSDSATCSRSCPRPPERRPPSAGSLPDSTVTYGPT